MSRRVLSAFFLLLALPVRSVLASGEPEVAAAAAATATPLTSRRFTYPNLPYQVDPNDPPDANGGPGRGPQSGFNICNSTTQTQTSQCQTGFLNSLDDFCVWGPDKFNSTISDTEGQSVAYCTSPKHGTRVFPVGTITGAQFLRAPGYVQVTGTLNQVNVNLQKDDGGGELDPHGADARGNPLGGLIFSNAFPSNGGKNDSYQQVIEWHNFMGDNGGTGTFCIKACDPAVANSKQFCQNLFDRIGCAYNAPASYAVGEYSVCDSDNQIPPGIYTDASGATQTFSQPPEGVPIETMPYDPVIPATSNCVPFKSADLFGVGPPAPTGASTSGSASATQTGSSTSKSGTTSKSASAGASNTVKGSSTTAHATATGSGKPNSAAAGPGGVLGGGVFVAVAASVMAGLGAVVAML